jgi:hypothetical protein
MLELSNALLHLYVLPQEAIEVKFAYCVFDPDR